MAIRARYFSTVSCGSYLCQICAVVGATERSHVSRPGGTARTNSGCANGPVLHSLVISQGESLVKVESKIAYRSQRQYSWQLFVHVKVILSLYTPKAHDFRHISYEDGPVPADMQGFFRFPFPAQFSKLNGSWSAQQNPPVPLLRKPSHNCQRLSVSVVAVAGSFYDMCARCARQRACTQPYSFRFTCNFL